MNILAKSLGATLIAALLAAAGPVFAQRARTVTDQEQTAQEKRTSPAPNTIPPAPQAVKVKYEGGIFGYNKKIDGTLSFDDDNRRLIFRDKQLQEEKLSIPYDALTAAFADTQSKRPVAADVIGRATLYTLPALLIKKKYRYLTLQFRDPDTQASGTTSFKFGNKEILTSMLNALAGKAGLTPRGDIFVRRRVGATASPSNLRPRPR